MLTITELSFQNKDPKKTVIQRKEEESTNRYQ